MIERYFVDDAFNEAKRAFIDGNYKVSEPILQQMILHNTRNPEVFQMLATIYYDKGQFNKAIKTFRRALEIDPAYTDASVGLSIILNDLGKYDEGREVFEEAKRILDQRKNSTDPYIEEKLASKHEELADLYYQYRRYNESLDQVFKALKMSSRKAELTLRLADLLEKTGDPERAISELKNLIKNFPHLNQARIRLGQILYNQNNIAAATEQWENVLMRDPNQPEALKLIKIAQAAGISVLAP